MEISPQLAQEIVANMQEILNQELNYINTSGTIIASTDPSRISTYHEGAILVVKTKKQLIITHDSQYKGVKKGINFPVFFENEIVGVIGITGNKDDVFKYGKILQKMSELLIKEAYVKDLEFQKENNERILVEQILNYDEASALNISKITNFDASIPRILLVAKTLNKETLNTLQQVTLDLRRKGFVELHTTLNNEMILFINHQNKNLEITLSILKNASQDTDSVFWGVGTLSHSYEQIQDSYHNAKVAATWGRKIKEQTFTQYEDEPLSILLSEIPTKKVEYFLTQLFQNLNDKEMNELEEIIYQYGNYNGSINKCADALFIHKNTLQYKLKK